MKLASFGATLLFLLASVANAQVIAYDVPAQGGNQAYPGNLGMDFDVIAPITVSKLGAFDNNGNGFAGTVQVQIFNRNTAAPVGPVATFTGAAGTLVNGSRFLAIAPLTLPAGQYSIVAVGFNGTDLNGNLFFGGATASTMNTGGGAISFVGTGRWDGNTTLAFPTDTAAGLPPNVFLAGTFAFSPGAGNPGSLFQPSGIAANSTSIFVTDTGRNQVAVYDAFGNFRFRFGSLGAGAGQFNGPTGIAVNATNIFVADTGNNRVSVFDLNGNFRYHFGTTGSAPGQFQQPSDLTLTPAGLLLVVDKGNNRVQAFDTFGNFRFQFGL